MADSVHSILSRLEPISDKVIRKPLSVEEIHALESAIGVPAPACVRDYFSFVGLFQDLTHYSASEFEVFDRLNLFRESGQFLAKNFGQSVANLFPFAGDGAGDIIAVDKNGMLFFADHETGKLKQIGTFCGWLSTVVDTALKEERPANSEKEWCVQFSFRVSSSDPILSVMGKFGTVSRGEWSEPKISPSDVHSSEAALVFGKEQLLLKRSEYRTWEQPMFSLDYNEPADVAVSNSTIRKLDAAFREAGLGYKLVDYGPLLLGWAKHESACQPKKTWWERFWARLMQQF